MGASATHHARLAVLERHLASAVHESQRIRRVACKMEYRDHVRDLRLEQALARRRQADLRCVRH